MNGIQTLDQTEGAFMDAIFTKLAETNDRLDRMTDVLGHLEEKVTALEELKHDMVPIANEAFGVVSRKMQELERSGALSFARESVRVAETVARSFDEEDVRLLGANIVHILTTVRNLTQPEVLDVADRASVVLREAEAEPENIGLLRALRDPEVRRGMALLLSVMRALGATRTPISNPDVPVPTTAGAEA